VLAENGAPDALAGAVTGIGFIGGGLVFRQGNGNGNGEIVRGVTTAAAIFATAAIGAAAGEGQLLTASLATALVLVSLELQHVPALRFLDARREDVPRSVELRWRPVDRQATLTRSSWQVAPTVSAASRSRAARRLARCRWPLTRRNCLPASIIPAAHQRIAMSPSRQRFTFADRCLQTPIMDSMALVERKVRANVGGTPSRSTVRVSASPSRRLAATRGWVVSSSRARACSCAWASSALSAW